MKKLNGWLLLCCLGLPLAKSVADETILTGHPRHDYLKVPDIDQMENELRRSLGALERYSFSRGWWKWDRLRQRYVDGGRRDENAIRILRAVFRALILDWHARCEQRGEGDLFYIFFTTNSGNKVQREASDGRTLKRDHHGGGYHGGWGGASRMRIYEELVQQDMLNEADQARMKKIVHQSLSRTFINFKSGSQHADNHSFGNGGGVALGIKMFPNVPQAKEARAWLDRIWDHMADFGDWTEWNYYPYGPIFLHGLVDIAEATGRLELERGLIDSLGRRCLQFAHGNGVRGGPNCGIRQRTDFSAVYADPWNVGYYDVETSGRDAHFWYRMAQHYKNPEYLWAAEQVALGGRPPDGQVPPAYQAAYNKRFAWFLERGIEPKVPRMHAKVGLLSELKKKVKERIYLNNGVDAGKPIAAFFLYDKKDSHLDNVSGFLYDYSYNGAKFLHSSGKYNNVYSGTDIRGGGSGNESLDALLVVDKRHQFPVHPDRKGDKRDYRRMYMAKHLPDLAHAENNDTGDAYGQFGFADYFGPESRWIRMTVLTVEGYLVVADEYQVGEALGQSYHAGPVWHLARVEGRKPGRQNKNWFGAPAFAQAWWQKEKMGVAVVVHDHREMVFGTINQSCSQDLDLNTSAYAYRPVEAGRTERFFSVLVPHKLSAPSGSVARGVTTAVSKRGRFVASVGDVTVKMDRKGNWSVSR
ncbi:MAG: hypothetical protein QF721_09580 [Verrucomicrobiota bacterium]|nr:hypothetical protein [Verrucomicrobiota bacterium]